ncbi:hypothetical protein R9X47_22665 [Wukongibacter baidiensis]|uniref:hypothetical protein n=1 Tax=Wukongibacter baidiensis TaxID=1723361 RepID=UPI003D7F5356
MLSKKEAYKAMILFLENYYSLSNSEYIADLLSSMMLLGDGKPADSALWEDWIEAVNKTIEE